MKQFVDFVVSNLVGYPNDLEIEEVKDKESNLTQINISLNPKDMGRIIGKNGRTIKAIRNLAKIKAIKNKQRVIITLKEKAEEVTSKQETEEQKKEEQ